jgi:hypothetical protein
MKRSLLAVALAVLIAGAAAVILLNRPTTPPLPANMTGSNTPPPPKVETLRGVSLSPRSYASPDFTNFFTKAKGAGKAVTWSGDWADLSNLKSAPYVVAQLAANNGLKPVIIAQFFMQSTGKLLRPLNDSTKQSYKAGAVGFVKAYKPEYIGFGIEINVLHEVSPADYASFKEFFSEVAKAVKQEAPGTKVFTVFQLERLKGLRGGLFGGADDPTTNDWALLGDYPDADIIAFTTYPCLVYGDPFDLPPDYYSEIATHTTKPIAFTEAGWFRVGPKEWESSPDEQGRFATRYIELTRGTQPRLLVWSFLYDQAVAEPFTSMGLLGKDDSTSPAWEVWLKP